MGRMESTAWRIFMDLYEGLVPDATLQRALVRYSLIFDTRQQLAEVVLVSAAEADREPEDFLCRQS